MGGAAGLPAFGAWVTGEALPLWATRGFDAGAGRFRERLSWAGAPVDVPHRAMVQARQVYVYAHACRLGWFAEGGAVAERAMASLVRDFATVGAREASFAYSTDALGRTVSDVRDAYTHAFVLFAVAWLYRLNGDRSLLALADKTHAFVRGSLVDARHGGVWDAYPVASRTKRQNPLMHLLEAYLALERAAPGRGYLEEARGIVDLFETRLFEPAAGVLPEHFAEDWGPAAADAGCAGVWEPGHHFEWVWLLDEYRRLGGGRVAAADRLYETARGHGEGSHGLLVDEVGADLAVRKASHRVWPHTEAIKAAAARHRAGDAEAALFAGRMARGLLDHFLGRPFAGGWTDHVDEAVAPLVGYVPASSLYHLFFAAAEAAPGL